MDSQIVMTSCKDIIGASTGACLLLGRSAEVLRSSVWDQIVHNEDIVSGGIKFDRLLTAAIDYYECPTRFLLPNGRIISTEIFVSCSTPP